MISCTCTPISRDMRGWFGHSTRARLTQPNSSHPSFWIIIPPVQCAAREQYIFSVCSPFNRTLKTNPYCTNFTSSSFPAKTLSIKQALAFYDALSLSCSCQWRVQSGQLDPFHTLTPGLSKNNLSTHLRALFTSDFLTKILYACLNSYTRTTRPIHLILRDFITLT
jgi:hypothetical protein